MSDYKYRVMIDKVIIQNQYMDFVASIHHPDLSSKICIQIPSFCDEELLKTIDSYIKNAANPDRLMFAICLQDDDTKTLKELRKLPNCNVKFIPAEKSPGLCAARYFCNKMLRDEEYVLHTDSHMRAARYWDVAMLFMWQDLQDEKAILSSYPLDYAEYVNLLHDDDIFTKLIRDTGSFIGVVSNFNVEGTVRFKGYDRHREPETIPGMFISGGCVFAKAMIDKDCPSDPFMFFVADEGTMDARYFTHGYRVYHPAFMPFWHWYGERFRKNGSPVQRFNTTDKYYLSRRIQEEHRIRSLFGLIQNPIDLKEFGFGTEKSFDEFLEVSGIDFKHHACRGFAMTGHYFQDKLSDADKLWHYHVTQSKIVDDSIHVCKELALSPVQDETIKTICIQVAGTGENIIRMMTSFVYQAVNANRLYFCICLPDSKYAVADALKRQEELHGCHMSFLFLPDDIFVQEARVSCQMMYDREDYVLFMDSDVMAVRDWDMMIIRQLEHIHDENSVISCKLPDFGPARGRDLWRGSFDMPYDSVIPDVSFSRNENVKNIVCKDFQDTMTVAYQNTQKFDVYVSNFDVCDNFMFARGNLNERITFPNEQRKLAGCLISAGFSVYTYKNCYLLHDDRT